MDVTGQDIAPVPHVDGQRKGLASGRGAHVQRTSLRLRRCRCGHQSGRGVLHREVPLRKGGQALQIAGGRHFEAALQPWVGVHRHAGGAQLLLQLLRRTFQRIGLDGGGDDLVVHPQVVLRLLRPDHVDQAAHQPLGMAVPHGQIVRCGALGQRGHVHPVGHKLPQHRIDHACGLGTAPALGHLHRLVDGGAVGDLIHEQDLIPPDAQDIQNHRLQPVRLLAAPAADIVVQQTAVLDDTVGKTRAERRLPAVQLVFGNGAFQTAVRPGVGAADLHQHLQRSITGAASLHIAHTSTCTGCPRR